MRLQLLIPLLIVFSPYILAMEDYSFPTAIDEKGVYVFYSHGYIVQGTNPTPIHPRWGMYDFPAVKKALSDASYHLIAAHRPANSDTFVYAKKIAQQVNQLLEAGVPAKNITLIGFSHGGFITAAASNLLKNTDLNFVILAACTSGLAKNEEVVIYGHLFSIYETSDSVGSCDKVVARSGKNVSSYKEISISTGKEHGAFYTPLNEWLLPVKNWQKREE